MHETQKAIQMIDDVLQRLKSLEYQDRRKVNDMFTDVRLVIRRVFGQESVWMHDIKLVRFEPSDGIYNSEHYKMTGAWKDGSQKMLLILNGIRKELSTFGQPSNGSDTEHEMTWETLWHHLTWNMWLAIGSLIVAAFSAGVALGQTTFIKQLFGKIP